MVEDGIIEVSVLCSSNRPTVLEWFINNFKENTINYEIVICGPLKPQTDLPKNVKFITSNTKPAQCVQIAALNSKGETVVVLADDCKPSKKFLNDLYFKYKEINDYKCIVVPNFLNIVSEADTEESLNARALNKPIEKNEMMRMVIYDLNSPIAHAGGLVSRKFFNELNGFDRKFIGRYFDLDFQMRTLNAGCRLELLNSAWIGERKDLCNNTFLQFFDEDYKLYSKLWYKDGVVKLENILTEPSEPFEPYEINDILTKSQSNNKHWE